MKPKPHQRVSAKAVIVAESGILVLHPSAIDQNRKWHIPGGIRDTIDEPITDTAIREVQEETGIDLSATPGNVVKVAESLAIDHHQSVKILAVFYRYDLIRRPPVRLSHEHDEAVWVDVHNYRDYQVNDEVIDLIRTELPQARPTTDASPSRPETAQ